MEIKNLFTFVCIGLFLIVTSLAQAEEQQKNITKKFSYSYNTLYTKMTAYPGSGIYKGLKVKKLAQGKFKNKIQPWSGYCPPCTLKNKKNCKKLPCQTNNLKMNALYEGIEVKDNKWMKLANQAAIASVQHGGGPFGAVIVQIDNKTGHVIRYWVNHNHVVQWSDPTAHAEVSTIRAAAQQLGVIDLGHIRKQDSKLPQPSEWSHCVIYSSAEPCPMCIAAIYWAGIKQLAFAATRYDAAVQGVNFSDEMIYEELQRPYSKRKHMNVVHSQSKNSLGAFNYYKRTPVKRYGAN